jgi:hypothetical protein
MKTNQILFFLCLPMAYSFTSAELSWSALTRSPISRWGTDSLFVGSGLIVRDSRQEIVVTWDYAEGPIGSLYYVESLDSSRFIFHNHIDQFPGEQKVINLGCKMCGSLLPFKYFLAGLQGEMVLYTGQNREGVDEYVSNMSGSMKRAFSLSGRVNDSTVKVGFEMANGYAFQNIVFTVSNVFLEGREKHKISQPKFVPTQTNFSDSLTVSISVPDEGLISITKRVLRMDTISPAKNGAILKIYYTTDGSQPDTNSPLFKGPFTITSTTTIKAMAQFEGDTNWFQSDVGTMSYTRDPVRNIAGKNGIIQNAGISGIDPTRPLRIYDMQGKLVAERYTTSFMAMRPALRAGLYFLHYSAPGAGMQVRKVLVAD